MTFSGSVIRSLQNPPVSDSKHLLTLTDLSSCTYPGIGHPMNHGIAAHTWHDIQTGSKNLKQSKAHSTY